MRVKLDIAASAERPQLGQAPVRAAVAGSAAVASPTLEALYREHFRFVWRSARRLGVPVSQLDDVVQDVFLVVHRQLADYQPCGSARSWLFSITRRVAADHRRALRRKAGGLLPLQGEPPARSDEGPLADALSKERSDLVLEFLASVDDDLREAFILCELEQMSAPEIAEAVAASTSAVYSRIRTARQAFVRFVRARHPELLGGAHG